MMRWQLDELLHGMLGWNMEQLKQLGKVALGVARWHGRVAGCCCCCDVVLNALPLKVLHCTGGDLFIRVLTGPAWCRSSYLYFVICILYFVFVLYFVFFILHRWRPFYQGAAGSSWAWSRPSKVHPPAHETRKMVSIEGTRGAAL